MKFPVVQVTEGTGALFGLLGRGGAGMPDAVPGAVPAVTAAPPAAPPTVPVAVTLVFGIMLGTVLFPLSVISCC